MTEKKDIPKEISLIVLTRPLFNWYHGNRLHFKTHTVSNSETWIILKLFFLKKTSNGSNLKWSKYERLTVADGCTFAVGWMKTSPIMVGLPSVFWASHSGWVLW